MFVREQSGKTLAPWREAVKRAALLARGIDPDRPDQAIPGTNVMDTLTGTIRLSINFIVPRPASVPERKRPYPTVAPDLDKYIRGAGDALREAGVYKDDAQICVIQATKTYGNDHPDGSPGAWIVISEVPAGSKLL